MADPVFTRNALDPGSRPIMPEEYDWPATNQLAPIAKAAGAERALAATAASSFSRQAAAAMRFRV